VYHNPTSNPIFQNRNSYFLNRISNVILFSKMLNSNQVKKHANKKRGEEKWKTTVTVVLYTREKYQIV
uniref:hypothetical protein n=1 Tax=Anaerobutyricum hallii TaxID=39488 RepID=UPI003FF0D39E